MEFVCLWKIYIDIYFPSGHVHKFPARLVRRFIHFPTFPGKKLRLTRNHHKSFIFAHFFVPREKKNCGSWLENWGRQNVCVGSAQPDKFYKALDAIWQTLATH